MEFALLFIACFFAGFVDSISGGGGLIQLPALMLVFPQLPTPVHLGTNKFSSSVGTAFAVFKYRHHLKGIWEKVILLGGVALVSSYVGAHLVSEIPEGFVKPTVLVILFCVFLFTLLRKNFGLLERQGALRNRSKFLAIVLTAVIGCYDGFLGPGTGGFFIFMFVSVVGFSFLKASASSKVLNLATNIAALAYFASTSQIHYRLAIPMAAANLAGSFAGVTLANKHGATFVRKIFLTTSLLLLIILAYRFFL